MVPSVFRLVAVVLRARSRRGDGAGRGVGGEESAIFLHGLVDRGYFLRLRAVADTVAGLATAEAGTLVGRGLLLGVR